ncbi:MAG: RluA family pseudouridine synthase, partial [Clostridiaceae bacterium]|nr:RluA family pseudouridine synthase [Clostridiaceae bacterium]
HPLLGDGKYGINKLNRGYKKQWLCSYKLVFDFDTDAGILNYLNQKDFEIDVDWMKDEFTRLSQE